VYNFNTSKVTVAAARIMRISSGFWVWMKTLTYFNRLRSTKWIITIATTILQTAVFRAVGILFVHVSVYIIRPSAPKDHPCLFGVKLQTINYLLFVSLYYKNKCLLNGDTKKNHTHTHRQVWFKQNCFAVYWFLCGAELTAYGSLEPKIQEIFISIFADRPSSLSS
jgi:hypothetical protein